MSKRTRNVLIVLIMVFALFALTGCKNLTNSYTLPINTWQEEKGLISKFLVWPIAWIMHFICSWLPESSGGKLAFGIFLTTILVRTLAWPIYAKTNDMSLKMTIAQPEIERLQQKYANRKDPQSQQRMQQEMMAIYKRYKISFLGCLMPILQMPLFLAMYAVVRRISLGPVYEGETLVNGAALQVTGTNFLGLKNFFEQGVYGGQASTLWSGNFIVGVILSLLVGATMLALNLISQRQPKYVKKKPGQQKNQMASTMKIFNYMMIVMMVFAALSSNSLAFYWLVGNIYSIGQTLLTRKLNEVRYYKAMSDVEKFV